MPTQGLTAATLRVLGQDSLEDADEFLRADPVANVFIGSRLKVAREHGWRLGGELWGFADGGRLQGVCYSGANLVPASTDPRALRAFAERAKRQGRRCSSIVGLASQISELWGHLESSWGPPREYRADQPLLAIEQAPLLEPDPGVRRVEPHELELILPACIEMFTEEVGVSPLGADGGVLYRARVRELVMSGRAFARFDGDELVFKAEVGAASRDACQVQGVWVPPRLRGQGLSAPAMAAVVASAQATIAPVVSLYVNAFNVAARHAYERVGFNQVGQFSTVLF
jgi:predicted GNAT family acetyltransferase